VARNPVSQSIRVCRCRAPSSGYNDFFGGSNLLLCVKKNASDLFSDSF